MLASKSPPRSGVALNWDSTFSFDSLPAAFGRFRVLHQLGAGVLGPVFRASDETDGRATAVKLFVFDFTPERAQECARLLERLASNVPAHPSLVRVIAAGCEGSLVYLAQDYLSGVPLDALLRDRGPLATDETLGVLNQLATAIDTSAAAGVWHGRLHPRDVLVSLPNVWVTGHGVASTFEDLGVAIPVRRPYTAPERHVGQPWDLRADVYSLATMAYEMITGRRMGTTGDVASLSSAPIEPAVREVLACALSSDPGMRPSSAAEFVDALRSAMTLVATPAVVPEPIAPEPVLVADTDTVEPYSDLVVDLAVAADVPIEIDAAPLADEPRRSFPWGAAAALVAIVAATAFGAGYLSGLSGVPEFLGSLVPGFGVRQNPGTSEPPNPGTSEPRNDGTSKGRDWTDGTIAEPPKAIEAPPAAAPPAPQSPRTPEPKNSRASEVRNSGTAEPLNPRTPEPKNLGTSSVLAVRSRPEGARVFLNGRAVGVSPLVLTDVAPGAHRVGLELAGYQRWSSLVRVGSGTRHSVTASLDRLR